MCYVSRFKKLAIEETRKSDSPNFAFSAVIVGGNRNIISIGHNNPWKTHPRSTHPLRTIHAELSAIIRAKESVEGATMFVARTSPARRLISMARPCAFCYELIHEAGISKVWYTTRNRDWDLLEL